MRAKFLAALFALIIGAIAPAVAADPPPIFVGGSFIRQHAIDDGRGHLLVPVRGVFEAFHADVTYTPPRFVVVRKDGVVVAGLIVGRNHAVVGNRPRALGVAPIRRHKRIYVPLRVIAEIAGATVVYSANPRLVDIRLPDNELPVPRAAVLATVVPAASIIPSWSYALVGAALLALLVEICRQVAVVARTPAQRAVRPTLIPLRAHPLQLPHAGDAGDQHGIGQIRK